MKKKAVVSRRNFMASATLGAAAIGISSRSVVAAASPNPAPTLPLRLHRNESPYGLSPSAAEVVRNAANLKPNRYPIEEPAALVEALAKRHGVAKEQILLGCGSIEILTMATGAFCSPSRKAVVAEPTF